MSEDGTKWLDEGPKRRSEEGLDPELRQSIYERMMMHLYTSIHEAREWEGSASQPNFFNGHASCLVRPTSQQLISSVCADENRRDGMLLQPCALAAVLRADVWTNKCG